MSHQGQFETLVSYKTSILYFFNILKIIVCKKNDVGHIYNILLHNLMFL